MAGVMGTVITYLGEFMSNKNRPRYLAFVVSFMTLAIALQPLIGLLVLTRSFEWSFFDSWVVYKPWRLFIFINGLIPGFGFFGMMLLPESPKFQLAMRKPNETLDIMRKMFACNTGYPMAVSKYVMWEIVMNPSFALQKFPVQKIIALEETGTNLSEVSGFNGALLLVWNQTKPLFYPPYLFNMLMMCGSIFAMSFVIHGHEFWYPQILSYYSKNIDLPITICEAISMGHTAELPATRNTSNGMNR